MFGKGISKVGSLLDMAVEYNIIEKSGAWFSYNGDKIGQGKENAKNFLEANEAIYAEVEEKVKKAMNGEE